MISNKDIKSLKKLAHNLKPIIQLGKNSITDSFITQLDEILEIHELVKISIHATIDLKKDEIIDRILKNTNAYYISYIGRKFVIYRESSTKERKDRLRF